MSASKIEFGEKLREIRIKEKMSQAQFGKELGVSKNTIINYETGRTVPKMEFYLKLSERFDVPIESILKKSDRAYIRATLKESGERLRQINALCAKSKALHKSGAVSEAEKARKEAFELIEQIDSNETMDMIRAICGKS